MGSFFTCPRCGQSPPRESYRCKECGQLDDEHPFPLIGCQCLADAHICLKCLATGKKRT